MNKETEALEMMQNQGVRIIICRLKRRKGVMDGSRRETSGGTVRRLAQKLAHKTLHY